jgi:hypothetical protein
MNLYTGQSLLLPRSWRQVLEMPRHHHFGQLLAVAEAKPGILDMLYDRGITPREATWMVDGLRQHRDGAVLPWGARLLMAAGVISTERPGIWAMPGAVTGSRAIEVTGDAVVVAARFVTDPVTRRMTAQRPLPADGKTEGN